MMRLTTICGAFVSIAVLVTSAGGAVVFDLVLDPATAAGGGSTSTQSGLGTWHLFALDINDDSLGLSSYSVNVTGATSVFHRSPLASIYGDDGDVFSAGFSLARTPSHLGLIQAAQSVPDLTPYQITGFGRTAGDMYAQVAAINASATIADSTITASWGNSITAPASINGNQWMYVAEGTYAAGAAPIISPIGTTAQVYNPDRSIRFSDVCIGWPCNPVAGPSQPQPAPITPPQPNLPPPPVQQPPVANPNTPPAPAGTTNGAVVFDLVFNPTTASSGSSGPGTWQLFALDTNDNSRGISSYSVNVTGATSILHRSPMANACGEDGDVFSAGFSLVRTGSNASPIQAAQSVPDLTPFQIGGFGQSAGDFATTIGAIDPNATIAENPASSSWGSEATAPAPIDGKQWLLLAEGTYADGALPAISPIDTTAQVYNPDFSIRFADVCIGWPCVPVPVPGSSPPAPIDPPPQPEIPPPPVEEPVVEIPNLPPIDPDPDPTPPPAGDPSETPPQFPDPGYTRDPVVWLPDNSLIEYPWRDIDVTLPIQSPVSIGTHIDFSGVTVDTDALIFYDHRLFHILASQNDSARTLEQLLAMRAAAMGANASLSGDQLAAAEPTGALLAILALAAFSGFAGRRRFTA